MWETICDVPASFLHNKFLFKFCKAPQSEIFQFGGELVDSTPPPPRPEMKSWQIWTLLAWLVLQSTQVNPPTPTPNENLADLVTFSYM